MNVVTLSMFRRMNITRILEQTHCVIYEVTDALVIHNFGWNR